MVDQSPGKTCHVAQLILFECVSVLSESDEVTALRVAIQDLENEIEAQKIKIANTPMPLLRVSQFYSSLSN